MFHLLSPRLLTFFESEYIPRRIPAASPSTIKSYRITFRMLDRFLGRDARLCDLNNGTIAAFQVERLKEVRRPTVKRDLDNIKAVWRYCCLRGKLKEFPDLPTISCAAPTPIALSEDDIHRVWQAIQAETRPVVVSCSPLLEVPAPVWWSAIFLTCWDTGERFSAVFNLKEQTIDLTENWILFPSESRKGSVRDNLKPIAPDTAAALGELLELYSRRTYNTRVFRWALNKGLVWRRLADIMERAGLPDSREFKFHAIRKSVASHLYAAGGNAQRLLGHSSQRITDSHYLDPRIAHDDRGQLQRVFRPGEAV